LRLPAASGGGGWGRVYRARDTRLGRSVALKVIQPEIARDHDLLLRFEREARLSSSLNHPSIVTIYDFSTIDDTAVIAMELVSGESLRSLLARGAPVALKSVLSIASQIAAGLAAAHRIGVVHRDLKPENVMITPQGLVKILDFGLAKAMAATNESGAVTAQVLTLQHLVVGTAAYMSPEQARAQDVDFRTDQFSFGVILYEMLGRRHPFMRGSTTETLAAIDRDDPPALDGPPELLHVVDRCLETDRELRYASTDDLAVDVMHLRERSGELRVQRPQSRRSAAWPIAIGAFALAAILAAWLVARFRTSVPLRAPAYVALHLPGFAIPSITPINSPVAISPDARRIVIVGKKAGEPDKLWLRHLSSTAMIPIAGSEGGYSPSWSPDGRQVAFFAGGKLKVVAVDGGATRTLCDAPSQMGIAWNDAGMLVFPQISRLDGPGLFKVDSTGAGEVVRLTRPEGSELPHLWPEFLPDGKRFLFIGGRSSGLQASATQLELMVGSLDGGAPRRLGPIASRVVYRDGTAYYVRDGALVAQRFDAETLKFSGDPTVIVERVHYVRDSASAGFSVARNGTICFQSPRSESRLVVLNREGQELTELGRAVYAVGMGRLARDGNRFAVGVVDQKLGLADIWIYQLSGRAPSRITFDTFDEKAPVWSRDGQSLYYSIDIQGPPDIFKLNLDTSRREPVLMAPGVQTPLDVSPDDRILLYQGFVQATTFDLAFLRLGPAPKPQTFMATPFDDSDGRFSPDGRWVSFTSDVSGRPEVYVMRFPPAAAAQRISSAGGSTARWRADGRELTFLGPSGEMMSVAVIGRDFSDPKPLFRTSQGIASYELAPDGKRFIVFTAEIDPPPPVQLVMR